MRVSKIVCFFVVFSFIVSKFSLAIAKQEDISDGIYFIQSALDPNKCLDIECASKEKLAKMQLYEKNNTDAQKFYIYKCSDGYFKIRVVCSGQLITCMDDKIGSRVVQNSYDGLDSQEWMITPSKDGSVQFSFKKSGLFLDVYGAKTENGTKIKIWEDSGSKAQKFFLVPIKKFDTSGYAVSTCKNDMQVERIKYLAKFLGKDWDNQEIKDIINNSQICFGVYDKSGLQVGFVRVITDYKTTCFVVNLAIDKSCRGKGIGSMLMRNIVEHKALFRCCFSLIPSSEKVAMGYRLVGFRDTGWNYMIKTSDRG